MSNLVNRWECVDSVSACVNLNIKSSCWSSGPGHVHQLHILELDEDWRLVHEDEGSLQWIQHSRGCFEGTCDGRSAWKIFPSKLFYHNIQFYRCDQGMNQVSSPSCWQLPSSTSTQPRTLDRSSPSAASHHTSPAAPPLWMEVLFPCPRHSGSWRQCSGIWELWWWEIILVLVRKY